ncbi:unnamed protein product (macronuclear) [Paramecium tetraurelia]|uniref:Calcium-dependent protein kinase 1 n=1 Tax=Paramecium tetraurelia TaxID=5888 RepID=A0DUC8_PARTE|nr:uncharacterized protein GSPATT00020317001 [Paramecium tetraurelia]CAK86645.1 unnamed protein product [Paramecium tetraurelia]|eukprot:XP_001454042.1 hypothetical protein (macronuclear) [Paramecium tetraurelia strain d4-2]
MGSQCCSAPQNQQTIELIIDVKGSFHSQTLKNLNSNQIIAQNGNEGLKDHEESFELMGISPKLVLGGEDKGQEKRKALVQQDEKSLKKGEKRKESVSSVGTLKLGVEVFVNLKQGNIHKYYVTGEVLGEGSYGKVWKVTHKNSGMVRAMKQLKKSSLILEEQQRLFAEVNILRNLDHPHIVKLYELYQDEQNYYLITEYLSGGELFDRIKKMSYFSERKAASFMRDILSAVVYCHEQNIVHRDLKPENILFVNESINSTLKIIDFGTSRKYYADKKMTKKLGTAYYMAPEVMRKDYNEKCDVWSCGVVLYILLCGYPPFTGVNNKLIMQRISDGKIVFNDNDWALISKEAKTLISKMLQVDPNQRISAKQALADPWIDKHNSNEQVNLVVLQNLQRFQAESLFTQAVLSYIASQMTSNQEQEELIKAFQILDKDQNGILSKDELIEGYSQVLKDRELAIQEVNKILHIVDLNQSGQVDFSEFLMASMNQEKLMSLEKVKAAFKMFDANNDGKISKEELEMMIGNLEDNLWQQILVECNAEEEITEEEFINILLNQKL